jgi:hypothetical protein
VWPYHIFGDSGAFRVIISSFEQYGKIKRNSGANFSSVISYYYLFYVFIRNSFTCSHDINVGSCRPLRILL